MISLLLIPLAALSASSLREGRITPARGALLVYLWCLPAVLQPVAQIASVQLRLPALLLAFFWVFLLFGKASGQPEAGGQ